MFSLVKIAVILYLARQKEDIMSRVCEICGKKPQVGNNRSHANNATKRLFKPNLQKVRALINGKQKKILVCTSCIKADKVTKVVR